MVKITRNPKEHFDLNRKTTTKSTKENISISITGAEKDIKSLKSVKTTLSLKKQISKKDKLKLRKDVLMKKIDSVKQLKEESKKRKKRMKLAIIGDTNPLYDALPDLDLSQRNSTNSKMKQEKSKSKPKALSKAPKRRREMLKNITKFKALMTNEQFIKNSMATISLHVQAKAKLL